MGPSQLFFSFGGEGEVFSAGENDLDEVRSEELLRRFREPLDKTRKIGSRWCMVFCRGEDLEVGGSPKLLQ